MQRSDARPARPGYVFPDGRKYMEVAPTRDGCWVFVLRNSRGAAPWPADGVAVLRRNGGRLEEVRFYRYGQDAGVMRGMAMTHDEKTLIVTTQSQVLFLDVAKLTSGSDPLLGAMTDRRFSGTGFVAITPNDKYAFVNQENTEWLTLIDLDKARATGFSSEAIVGGLATGTPSLPVVSHDGRYLYPPNSTVDSSLNWHGTCPNRNPPGAIRVLDLERVGPDLKSTIIATIPAGCGTRRPVLSPDGSTLYALALQDHALLAFDLRPLRSG